MDMPNLSQALRTTVVDGRIYFDLEQMLDIMFKTANEASIMSTEMKDPALGIATLGMVNMCNALDAVLTVQKNAYGLQDRNRPCNVSKVHPRHRRMVGRQLYWCPGVAETV